jgi:segregation and condensation protein B
MEPQRDRKFAPPQLGLEQFQDTPTDHGLSLDELSESFARLIGKGHDPYQGDPPAVEATRQMPADEVPPAPPPPVAAMPARVDDDPCPVSPRTILESMLFVGHPDNHPISSREVAALMRGVRPQEIDELVVELNQFYEQQGCPYRVVSLSGGYRLDLCDSFQGVREKFYGRVRNARLSQAAIDVLSIVAYHQPITRPQIDHLRDADSRRVLGQLVRRELLCLERPTGPGATAAYRTTSRFLKVFGLGSLDELPQAQDLEELR